MKASHNTANLIKPIAPQEYKAYMTWYNRSWFMLLISSIVLLFYTGYCYWQLSMLKKTGLTQMQPVPHDGDTAMLTKRLSNAQKKIQELTALSAQKSLFNDHFQSLMSAMPDDVCLGYCEYNHGKFIELSGQGRSLNAVTHFLQNIQRTACVAHLEIAKLQPMVDATQKEYVHFMLR